MNKLTKQRAPFTQVPNALLTDPNITLKAKGLYALMYSKPDGWQFYETAIARECREGKEAVSAGLDELVKFGWLRRSGGRQEGTNRFCAYDYEILATRDGLAVTENPSRESRDGKPATSNTQPSKTDEETPIGAPQPAKASPRANPASTLLQHLEPSGGVPPTEWGQWAHTTFGWDGDRISFEWDDFSDYWTSGNAKGGGRKSDWAATWRSHCRRVAGNSNRGYRAGGKARSGFAAAFASSVAARYGTAPAGGSVGGGQATGGAGEDAGAGRGRLPVGEIAF